MIDKPNLIAGKNYCLVCEKETYFSTEHDEDCNRCHHCMSLPYSQEDSRVLEQRAKWNKLNPKVTE